MELGRADGKVWPKRHIGVPTLFNVPNPPPPSSLKRPAFTKRGTGNVQPPKKKERSAVDQPHLSCKGCQEKDLEIKRLRAQLKKAEAANNSLKQNVSKCLNEDQLQVLEKDKPNAQGLQWSNQTVQQSMELRCILGRNGYKALRERGFPLPSYRTLCKRFEPLEMAPGIQAKLVDLLGKKLATGSNPMDCYACLAIDEVAIHPELAYDTSLKQFIGHADSELSPGEKLGSKVLVYMVKGLATKWKQTIAYFFTGKSVKKAALWRRTLEVIAALESSGIKVSAVVSDMGSSNVGMWREAGISTKRTELKSSIVHPCDSQRFLYFLADVPHLLKSLRNCLLNFDIYIPEDVAAEYGLPSAKVSSSVVKELIEIQENSSSGFKLAPKLKKVHLEPGQFQKMKVSFAAQMLSHSTASAINTLVDMQNLPLEATTTAWFCDFINRWFDTMNGRHFDNALFPGSKAKLCLLEEVMKLFSGVTFSSINHDDPEEIWKPIQSGVRLSSHAMLGVFKDLVIDGPFEYLLTGRCTQDALENLFSQIRALGDPCPTSVRFRRTLRLVTLGQLSTSFGTTSYEEDDSLQLLNFLKIGERTAEESVSGEPAGKETSDEAPDDMLELMSHAEKNAFVYMCGWLCHKAIEGGVCDGCRDTITSNDAPTIHYLLVENREYTGACAGLVHPSDIIISLVEGAESIFSTGIENMETNANLLETLQSRMMGLIGDDCSVCYYMHKIVERFLKFRLHLYAKTVTEKISWDEGLGSKSVARKNKYR